VTNVDRRSFDRLTGGSAVDIRIGGHIVAKVVSTYADAADAEVCALFGSTDHLEIAANGSSAATLLALERGAPVTVTRRA
jgi:S-adenosylmethionine hydrolase